MEAFRRREANKLHTRTHAHTPQTDLRSVKHLSESPDPETPPPPSAICLLKLGRISGRALLTWMLSIQDEIAEQCLQPYEESLRTEAV
jgi:hypothetical protein